MENAAIKPGTVGKAALSCAVCVVAFVTVITGVVFSAAWGIDNSGRIAAAWGELIDWITVSHTVFWRGGAGLSVGLAVIAWLFCIRDKITDPNTDIGASANAAWRENLPAALVCAMAIVLVVVILPSAWAVYSFDGDAISIYAKTFRIVVQGLIGLVALVVAFVYSVFLGT